MKLAVIGANGKSGRAFLEAALKAGHEIRAAIHHHNSLPNHPRLHIMTCDTANAADVTRLIEGQEAVVSFIGHVRGSDANVQTIAMRTICTAMKIQGMTRIVSLTGTGVRFPGDNITLLDRILTFGIEHIDPKRIQDGRDHVAVLQESSLDWTVIRVLKLRNGKHTNFSLKVHGPAKLFVHRTEVAEAALEVLANHSFVQAAPIIGNHIHITG